MLRAAAAQGVELVELQTLPVHLVGDREKGCDGDQGACILFDQWRIEGHRFFHAPGKHQAGDFSRFANGHTDKVGQAGHVTDLLHIGLASRVAVA